MAQKRDLIPITVYLPPELIANLRLQAKKNHISFSAIVRQELLRPRVEGRDRAG